MYRVANREIQSSRPQFQCVGCLSIFSFEYPVADFQQIPTKLIALSPAVKEPELKVEAPKVEVAQPKNPWPELPAFAQTATVEVETPEVKVVDPHFKACPQCQTLNPKSSPECLRCQVVFAKIETLKSGAIPSLVKAWQDLMSDYNNIKRHIDFVDRCEDLQALPFALKKYQALKEAQPQDELAHQVLNSIVLTKLSQKANEVVAVRKSREWLSAVNWKRVIKLSPLMIGTLLMTVGIFSHSSRNMVGIGAALWFLTIGFTVILKGRVRAQDLWS